ncbi:hypothetical protein 101136BS1_010 [Escherichia phage vB_EcoP-101136BS1]|nr:hypothetical protein 101136BS1_010 [Escherichia phage vB_EcoP-101136BS1]
MTLSELLLRCYLKSLTTVAKVSIVSLYPRTDLRSSAHESLP